MRLHALLIGSFQRGVVIHTMVDYWLTVAVLCDPEAA
jgi:hypothetical protein